MTLRRFIKSHLAPLMVLQITALLCLSSPQAFADSNPSSEKVAQIQKDANQGDASAQAKLSDLYRYGEGVKKDSQKSFQWASKAAEQGHVKAQHYLGICYTYEMGVKKDLVQAFNWFKKSADQGYVNGQYRVGACYLEGHGITRSDELGVEWLVKAAKQGDTDAKSLLGEHFSRKAIKEMEEFENADKLSNRLDLSDPFASIEPNNKINPLTGTPLYEETLVTAYMWLNLAAADGRDKANKALDAIAKLMSTELIKKAQSASAEWKPEK